jgi:hypothetical protein
VVSLRPGNLSQLDENGCDAGVVLEPAVKGKGLLEELGRPRGVALPEGHLSLCAECPGARGSTPRKHPELRFRARLAGGASEIELALI